MEILAEQPFQNQEQIDHELRLRNDTATWLAETLHGSMRTSFEYYFDGQDLRAEDGSGLEKVFDEAIATAKEMVDQQPNLLFELRRRMVEKSEYEDMLAMANGEMENTMVVISDYPLELLGHDQDIGGYSTSRKQTMMRVITRQPNGNILMVTQSLDGSNRQALEKFYSRLNKQTPKDGELLGQRIYVNLAEPDQAVLPNQLTDIYDKSLKEQYGGQWRAGIKHEDKLEIDTFQFVCEQQDLIEWFIREKTKDPLAAEGLRLNLAATMHERFETARLKGNLYEVRPSNDGFLSKHLLFEEIECATQKAVAGGRTFSGCGMSIGSQSMAEQQFGKSGYGNKSDEDEFGKLTFKCTAGHTNTRPRGRLINKCHVTDCKGTVGC